MARFVSFGQLAKRARIYLLKSGEAIAPVKFEGVARNCPWLKITFGKIMHFHDGCFLLILGVRARLINVSISA